MKRIKAIKDLPKSGRHHILYKFTERNQPTESIDCIEIKNGVTDVIKDYQKDGDKFIDLTDDVTKEMGTGYKEYLISYIKHGVGIYILTDEEAFLELL
jgi:hypothetical protein